MNDTQKVIEEMRFLASDATEKDILEWASRLEAEQKREPVAWARYSEGKLFDVHAGPNEPPSLLYGISAPLYTHPPADAGKRIPVIMPVCDNCNEAKHVRSDGPDFFGSAFHCEKCGLHWEEET